jgi:hypothetical protein
MRVPIAALNLIGGSEAALAAIERVGVPQKKKKRGMMGRLIRHFEKRKKRRKRSTEPLYPASLVSL